MKKSKFIELLNQIPGDVEVKLWNGFAGDWVNIETKLVPMSLVRMTESHYIESVRVEYAIKNGEWDFQLSSEKIAQLKKSYKRVCVWEDNELITSDDIKEGRYTAKVVYVIQAKKKGVDTWDRAGNISY